MKSERRMMVIVRRLRAFHLDPDIKMGQRVRFDGVRGILTVVDVDGTGGITLSMRDDYTGKVYEYDVRPPEMA